MSLISKWMYANAAAIKPYPDLFAASRVELANKRCVLLRTSNGLMLSVQSPLCYLFCLFCLLSMGPSRS